MTGTGHARDDATPDDGAAGPAAARRTRPDSVRRLPQRPHIARHQGWKTPYSRADGQALLDAQRGMAFGEAGRWMQIAIVGRTDGGLRGDCAVYLDDEPERAAELGITLAPRSHGSGLAAEALTAVIAVLVGEHAVGRLVMHVEPDNARAAPNGSDSPSRALPVRRD